MPIYEFYCQECNTVFNFYSRRINTATVPDCPVCGRALKKQLSAFATASPRNPGDAEDLPAGFDETKMEQALGELAQEAGRINEEDPRAMAQLMRRFSDRTGLTLNDNMEKALTRLEAGENPEMIEKEMADLFSGDGELPFEFRQTGKIARRPPKHDEKLYDLEQS